MRNLFVLVFVCLATATFAQVGSGLFVGGGIGFSQTSNKFKTASTSTDLGTNSNFSITPKIGYFFTDDIAAAISFGYNYGSQVNEATLAGVTSKTNTSTSGWTVGLTGRYAKGLGEESNFFILGDLNVIIGGTGGKTKTDVGSASTTVKTDPSLSVSVGVAPALLFFPTPKVGLEFGLGNLIEYRSTTVTSQLNDDNKTITSGFQLFNLNTMALNIGASYYFNR